MDTFVVVVGLVVAVGTPLSAYFATVHGHKVSERNSRQAAEAALKAAETAGRTALKAAETASQTAREVAALASQTLRREQTLNHFRWACDKATSANDAERLVLCI